LDKFAFGCRGGVTPPVRKPKKSFVVGVVQLAERQVVALKVEGSSPSTHPYNLDRPD
jgi:hypothetical protein